MTIIHQGKLQFQKIGLLVMAQKWLNFYSKEYILFQNRTEQNGQGKWAGERGEGIPFYMYHCIILWSLNWSYFYVCRKSTAVYSGETQQQQGAQRLGNVTICDARALYNAPDLNQQKQEPTRPVKESSIFSNGHFIMDEY